MTSLSLDGYFVDGLGAPTVGEPVRVGLQFVDGSSLSLPGVVVYRDRVQGFAVRFDDLTPGDAEGLTRGLQRHGLKDASGRR